MILRLLIGLAVLYLLYRLFKAWKGLQGGTKEKGRPAAGEDLVEDPYCHTYLPVSQAWKTVIDGKTLHFCSRTCLEAFKAQEKDP